MSSDEFSIQEAGHVGTRIIEWVQETASLERYSLTITGAIWSWCAANYGVDGNNNLWLVLSIPFFVSLIFGWRARALWGDIRMAEDYLIEVERRFLVENGWQNYKKNHRSGLRGMSAYCFWVSMISATGMVATAYCLAVAAKVAAELDHFILTQPPVWLAVFMILSAGIFPVIQTLAGYKSPRERIEI